MKGAIRRTAAAMEDRWDGARLSVKRRLGRLGPLMIQAFDGHGTDRRLFVHGRVIEKKGLEEPEGGGWRATLRNVRHMLRRFDSDEMPGARVRARHGGAAVEAVCDGEGFFALTLDRAGRGSGWETVDLELLEPRVDPDDDTTATAAVRCADDSPGIGVISDIDDTIMVTGATSLFRQARTVLLNGPSGRVAFPGVAAFYRALEAGPGGGPGGGDANPVFYVSSSPWNLYDLILRFLEIHAIPRGPVFLMDYGLKADQFFTAGHLRHKTAIIRSLIETWPRRRWVLIGDSGQRDAWVYAEMARAWPDRIAAVVLRLLDEGHRERIRDCVDAIGAAGIPVLAAETMLPAARLAERLGLVGRDAVQAVARDVGEDTKDAA